jgi:hypothetical protein
VNSFWLDLIVSTFAPLIYYDADFIVKVHHFSCNSASVLFEKTKGLVRPAELTKSLAISRASTTAIFDAIIRVEMRGGKKYLDLEFIYTIAENFAALRSRCDIRHAYIAVPIHANLPEDNRLERGAAVANDANGGVVLP